MKTITFALVILLALAPVALGGETFNPNTGEWEGSPDADEMVQDPFGDRPLYKGPDIETPYHRHQEPQDRQQLQDEPWSDHEGEDWDQPQEGDEWSGDQEDEGGQMDPSMLPGEGHPDGYGDEGFQEQRQEEPWSHSPQTMERGGPPPPLRLSPNRP
jgi:hypothetical protein